LCGFLKMWLRSEVGYVIFPSRKPSRVAVCLGFRNNVYRETLETPSQSLRRMGHAEEHTHTSPQDIALHMKQGRVCSEIRILFNRSAKPQNCVD
jgi:hypothetical protein